jgi:GT2 family glycosyltransferase
MDFEIIVVDNCSMDRGIDDYLQSASRANENFKFIKNKENLGFASANNIGYKNSSGEYIVFLNPDTLLLNNSFKILMEAMKNNRGIGICGPRLLYPDMSFQVSFYSFPSVMKNLLKAIGINKLMAKKPGLFRWIFKFKKIMPEYASMFSSNFEEITGPVEVPWLTGACLMIRASLFGQADMFDEDFKLYAEDMDLCLRVRKNGKIVYFIPGVKLIHYRGWINKNLESMDLYFKSHAYYYRKNFRGIYKNMLLFLNKIEWIHEGAFARIRKRFKIRNNRSTI